eukprot:2997690-Rhodomonas_salina.2
MRFLVLDSGCMRGTDRARDNLAFPLEWVPSCPALPRPGSAASLPIRIPMPGPDPAHRVLSGRQRRRQPTHGPNLPQPLPKTANYLPRR